MPALLSGKTALVTGGASGIGRAIALRYAEEGASVVVTDANEGGGSETASLVRARGARATFVRCDTSKPADNERAVSAAVAEFGALHVAVNNAGIGGTIAPVGEYPIDAWDRVIAINLSGVFYGMRYQIPAMLSSGGGAIVNMASILGKVGIANSAAYVAAKHGLVGLTEAAALEYGTKGIRVNTVGPGFIKTPLLAGMAPEAVEQIARRHAMARLGEPREVAEIVLWLSSALASFVTGAYYAVDGGYLAQ